MRRFIVLSTLLLVALIASAQIKVAPKMAKGNKKVYVSEVTTTVPGGKEVKLTTETLYEVTDATADGYVLDYVLTDLKNNADATDLSSQLLIMSMEVTKNTRIRYATDKDGQVTKILNNDEVMKSLNAMIEKIYDTMAADKPEITNVLSKETFIAQTKGMITEEALLQSVKMNTSPLILNGKTITTDMQDEFRNAQGLKMKRKYTVNSDGSIQTNANIDMSMDEIKQMVIEQLEKIMPGQIEAIKANIDMVINNPSFKIEGNEKSNYTFAPDGWVDTISSEMTSSMMGQKVSVVSSIKLKK